MSGIKNWNNISYSWIGRTDIVKIAVLVKLMHTFYAMITKILAASLREPDKAILKFKMEQKKSRMSKAIIGKNNKAGGIMIPDLKSYYKATVSKIAWSLDKNRHIEQ